MGRRARIGRKLAALALLPSIALAQDGPWEPEGGEGALRNDCFLPSSAEAGTQLAEGDAGLLGARAAGDNPEGQRQLDAAFERWFAALDAAEPGTAVWFDPHGSGERRATEGLESAVLRRLFDLSPAERRAWTERFEPRAGTELAEAAYAADLAAQVERRFPGTPSAARAALLLADRALEAGRASDARALVRRGMAHLELLAEPPQALTVALEARGRAADARDKPTERRSATWRDATRLELTDQKFLGRGVARRGTAPPSGVRPGLAFLDEDRFCVQTRDSVYLYSISSSGRLRAQGTFQPARVLADFSLSLDPRLVDRRPPGWPLLPVASDGDLYLVAGRTIAGELNGLVCMRPPPALGELGAGSLAGGMVPALRWAVVGDRRVGAAGDVTPVPELEELSEFEFQPGPLVVGANLLVQVRETEGEVRAWLMAFARDTGELRWKRLLAKGADLWPDRGRFGMAFRPKLASQPLAAAGDRVFASTHLGAGALFDTVDGRPLWSLKIRRRDPARISWSGTRPLVTPDEAALIWTPADSDRLYSLRLGPLGADADELAGAAPTVGAAFFVDPPRAIEGAETLIGAYREEIFVQGRRGASAAVSAWRRDPTARPQRVDSVYLGPEEEFRGRGLASERRVLAATDRGVYLFDRERELYLLDYDRLPPVVHPAGGDLYARGARVLVVGEGAVWALRAE